MQNLRYFVVYRGATATSAIPAANSTTDAITKFRERSVDPRNSRQMSIPKIAVTKGDACPNAYPQTGPTSFPAEVKLSNP